MSNKQINKHLVYTMEITLLIAIMLILAFTPIGYIKAFGVEITLEVIPVCIGAIVSGPLAGLILGTVFGLTSFMQCFGMSPFGAALLGINPISTLILCLIPRILTGLFTGLIFKYMNNSQRAKRFAVYTSSLLCPLMNTIFFMSALVMLFYNEPYIQNIANGLGALNPITFIFLFVGVNAIIEAVVCFLLGSAISKPLLRALNR